MVGVVSPMLTASEIAAAERRRRFRADIAEKAAALAPKKPAAQIIEFHRPEIIAYPWIPEPPRIPSIADIQAKVAAFYRVTVVDLRADRRTKRFAHARQVSMYIAYKLTLLSSQRVGDLFERDHSTVLHARSKIEALSRRDPDFAFDLATLFESLGRHPE